MSTIKINVTQDEIDNSEIGQPESCMVAEAFRRRLDLPETVGVDISIVRNSLDTRHGRIEFSLPRSVQQRIKRWDQGSKGKPFEFEVEFPDDWREKLGK